MICKYFDGGFCYHPDRGGPCVGNDNCGAYVPRIQHQPKGGMCAGCERRSADCSGLDFSSMRAIDRHGDAIIVKCDQYVRAQPCGQQ